MAREFIHFNLGILKAQGSDVIVNTVAEPIHNFILTWKYKITLNFFTKTVSKYENAYVNRC